MGSGVKGHGKAVFQLASYPRLAISSQPVAQLGLRI